MGPGIVRTCGQVCSGRRMPTLQAQNRIKQAPGFLSHLSRPRYMVLTGAPPFVAAPVSEMHWNIRDAATLSPPTCPPTQPPHCPPAGAQPGRAAQPGPPAAGCLHTGGLPWGRVLSPSRQGLGEPSRALTSNTLSGPAAGPLLPQSTHLHRHPASARAFLEGGPAAADLALATRGVPHLPCISCTCCASHLLCTLLPMADASPPSPPPLQEAGLCPHNSRASPRLPHSQQGFRSRRRPFRP